MLNLPHSAGALVRAKGSAETITAAFAADAQAQPEDRSIAGGEVRVRREYIWPEPTKVADNLRIRGVRFEGILSEESVASLRTTASPGEHGDRQRDKTRGVNWSVQAGDTSVRLKSPLGTTLTLTLLEP